MVVTFFLLTVLTLVTKFYFTIFLEHKIKFTFWVNFIFRYIFICFSEKSKLFPGMKQVFPWDENWFFYLFMTLFSSLFTLSKQNFILQNYWFFLIKFVFILKIISYHINFKESGRKQEKRTQPKELSPKEDEQRHRK